MPNNLRKEDEPQRKRRRIDVSITTSTALQTSASVEPTGDSLVRAKEVSKGPFNASRDGSSSLISFRRSISPPPETRVRRNPAQNESSVPILEEVRIAKDHNGIVDDTDLLPAVEAARRESQEAPFISSPVQLTHIRDLNASNNVDTIKLGDILGDPMIRECWQFNYLFDVDFVM